VLEVAGRAVIFYFKNKKVKIEYLTPFFSVKALWGLVVMGFGEGLVVRWGRYDIERFVKIKNEEAA